MAAAVLGSGRIVSERDSEAKNEPVTTQREHGDVAGVAAQTQDPGKAGDAQGGAMPRPRARNAREAAAAAGPEGDHRGQAGRRSRRDDRDRADPLGRAVGGRLPAPVGRQLGHVEGRRVDRPGGARGPRIAILFVGMFRVRGDRWLTGWQGCRSPRTPRCGRADRPGRSRGADQGELVAIVAEADRGRARAGARRRQQPRGVRRRVRRARGARRHPGRRGRPDGGG